MSLTWTNRGECLASGAQEHSVPPETVSSQEEQAGDLGNSWESVLRLLLGICFSMPRYGIRGAGFLRFDMRRERLPMFVSPAGMRPAMPKRIAQAEPIDPPDSRVRPTTAILTRFRTQPVRVLSAT